MRLALSRHTFCSTVPALDASLCEGHEVATVFTQPDQAEGTRAEGRDVAGERSGGAAGTHGAPTGARQAAGGGRPAARDGAGSDGRSGVRTDYSAGDSRHPSAEGSSMCTRRCCRVSRRGSDSVGDRARGEKGYRRNHDEDRCGTRYWRDAAEVGDGDRRGWRLRSSLVVGSLLRARTCWRVRSTSCQRSCRSRRIARRLRSRRS